MTQQYHNYIAGQWCKANDYISNINPSDLSDNIGDFARGSTDDIDNAIDAALEAQKFWANSPLELRYNLLMDIGNMLMNNAEQLGYELAREEGKPKAEGKGEIYRSGQFFTYYAAQTLRQIGDNADSVRPNIEIDMRREALGLVAVITPWNFPLATAAWKIAPALCYGNAVIWKPSELTPATAVAFCNIFDEVATKHNIPKAILNMVVGQGRAIGQHLVEHRYINGVTFTGSCEVGRTIAVQAAHNFTKVQLEMGSKNALLILNDANMDEAIANALGGAFGGTGQKCTASSRLIVEHAIYDEFVEKLGQACQQMVVGHALEDGTQLGPVVSDSQLQSNLANIERIKAYDAEHICGGERLELSTQGYYMRPALFANTQNHWDINQEELFGPIACVIKANDYEHGLSLVNDTKFGLSFGIMTQSLHYAHHFKRHAQSGCVTINLPTAGTDYHVAFGGRGQSSYGPREQGDYAKEFYTTVKTTYMKA